MQVVSFIDIGYTYTILLSLHILVYGWKNLIGLRMLMLVESILARDCIYCLPIIHIVVTGSSSVVRHQRQGFVSKPLSLGCLTKSTSEEQTILEWELIRGLFVV